MTTEERATPRPRATAEPGPPGWVSADLRALDDLIGRAAAGVPAARTGNLRTEPERPRTADEELLLQREQLARLLAERRATGMQRRWLASMLPVAMVVTDRRGTVLTANAAAGRLLRIAPAHLERKRLTDLVHDEDRPRVEALLDGADLPDAPSPLPVQVLPRRGDAVRVDLVVVADGWTGDEPDLAWTLLPDARAGAVPAAEPTRVVTLASAFAEMCWLPAAAGGTQEMITRIAEVTRRAVPAAEAVSVNLGSAAEPTAVASTSDLAAAFDGAQVAAGEGPCVTASEAQETVVTGDVHGDPRWARLVRGGSASDVRSVLAVPMTGEEGLVGAVNLYSTGTDAFSDEDVQLAELLAAAGGAVLAEVAQKDRLRELARQLDEALRSRAVIDEAKGIIMARRGGTPEEAFAYLSATSQQRNVKLRVLAAALVEQTATARPGPEGSVPATGGRAGGTAHPGVTRRRS